MNTKPQLFHGLKKDGEQTKQLGMDLQDRKDETAWDGFTRQERPCLGLFKNKLIWLYI